jgi:hypothetical protein
MKELKIGDKLFSYISLYGVHEFEIETISDVGNNLKHIVITGTNRFTYSNVVLLCLFDGTSITFIKFLSQSGDEDNSHWYKLGEFNIYDNPIRAYSSSVSISIKIKKEELKKFREDTYNKIKNMELKIKEYESNLNDYQFLLDYSKQFGLRNEFFKVHEYIEDFNKGN